MKTLFSTLEETLGSGQPAVLVTIIASSGSTPRGAGARMIVGGQGRLAGTVGGGAVEYRCITMAQELLDSDHPVETNFSLNREDTAGLGMVCGGQVQVHFLPIPPGDAAVLELCKDAAARFSEGTPFWLMTPLGEGDQLSLWPERPGDKKLALSLPEDGLSPTPKVYEENGQCWFCEQIQRPGTVYILGGGHVAQALVPVLAPLEFPCVVLEDREEFADPRLFPLAREVRLVDFRRLDRDLSLTDEDYVCIMTRGHQNDLLVQQQVLRMPACYIGLIGSAKKSAESFARLREMGFSQADLDRITTPIGLAIGGRTPAEIAISIAAQLIQHRAQRFPRG